MEQKFKHGLKQILVDQWQQRQNFLRSRDGEKQKR
jgi:hypothetical protein